MRSVPKLEAMIHAFDGDLVVMNKPPGLPTSGHTLKDEDCLQYHVMKHYGEMVWAVHQLDANTSGICLFSRSKALVGRIKAGWGDEATRKVYLGIIEGVPAWSRMEAHFPIGELSPNRLGVLPEGKDAHTSFEILSKCSGYALVRAVLHTGRTHQIRIHLSHLGYPLVGEAWYREEPSRMHPRHALHAYQLTLPPIEGMSGRSWSVPLPEDLRDLCQRLGLHVAIA